MSVIDKINSTLGLAIPDDALHHIKHTVQDTVQSVNDLRRQMPSVQEIAIEIASYRKAQESKRNLNRVNTIMNESHVKLQRSNLDDD